MSLSNVQTLAAHSVAAVEAGCNLSDVLAEIWRDHPQLSAQERGALQDIAYGCQRFSGSLRALLDLMLNKPLPRADIRSLILAALYQLAYSRNAAHAVVNEAVRAAGKIGKGQYKALTIAREMPSSAFCHAFLNPPYPAHFGQTARETGEYFLDFCRQLFGSLDHIETYAWNTDCSDYFADGREWWGTYFWTVYSPQNRLYTGIMGSATD